MAQPSVLLHFHLFKNAGTTLDWSLERSFGAAFCEHRDDGAMRGNPAYLSAYLAENPQFRSLSSHWLPLKELAAGLRAIVLLRDPIERMASVYRFERRQAVAHAGTEKARELNFQDYVRWRLEPGTGPVLRNFHARMLSDAYPGPDDEHQLELAQQRLRKELCWGLVSRYDESMCLLEYELGPAFGQLDLAYRRQNVTDPGDERSADERRAAVEEELGPVAGAALSANARDLRLYAACEKDFASRWAALPDRDERLAAFRSRCLALGER